MAQKKKKKQTKHTESRIVPPVDLETKPEGAPQPSMVDARRETLLGNYCNIALIHHQQLEFCFDFIWATGNQRFLVSRVITSPQHAKKVYKALGDNIEKYEKNHGQITVDE